MEDAEAARQDAASFARLKAAIRREHAEVPWWSSLASKLAVLDAGGAWPPGATPGAVMRTVGTQACLAQVSDEILSSHLREDERVFDVVWRELRLRLDKRVLRFMPPPPPEQGGSGLRRSERCRL